MSKIARDNNERNNYLIIKIKKKFQTVSHLAIMNKEAEGIIALHFSSKILFIIFHNNRNFKIKDYGKARTIVH